MSESNILKVGLAQISPMWLNREKTLEKIKGYIDDAGTQKCRRRFMHII
jgi:nitrilase